MIGLRPVDSKGPAGKRVPVKRGVKRVKFVKVTFLACGYQTAEVRITRGGSECPEGPRFACVGKIVERFDANHAQAADNSRPINVLPSRFPRA